MNSTTNKTSAPVINKLAAPAKSREKKANLLDAIVGFKGLGEFLPTFGTSIDNYASRAALGASLSEAIGRNVGAIGLRNPNKLLAGRIAAGIAGGGLIGGGAALASPFLTRGLSTGKALGAISGLGTIGQLAELGISPEALKLYSDSAVKTKGTLSDLGAGIGSRATALRQATGLAAQDAAEVGSAGLTNLQKARAATGLYLAPGPLGGGVLGQKFLETSPQRLFSGALIGDIVSEGARRLASPEKMRLVNDLRTSTNSTLARLQITGLSPDKRVIDNLVGRYRMAGVRVPDVPEGLFDISGRATDPVAVANFLNNLSRRAGRASREAEFGASALGLTSALGLGGLEGLAGAGLSRAAAGNLSTNFADRMKILAATGGVGLGSEALVRGLQAGNILQPVLGTGGALVGGSYLAPSIVSKLSPSISKKYFSAGIPSGTLPAAMGATAIAAGAPVLGAAGVLSAPFINPRTSASIREGINYLRERRAVSDLTKGSSYGSSVLSAPVSINSSLEKSAFLGLGRKAISANLAKARGLKQMVGRLETAAASTPAAGTEIFQPIQQLVQPTGKRPSYLRSPIIALRQRGTRKAIEKSQYEMLANQHRASGADLTPQVEQQLRQRARQFAETETGELSRYLDPKVQSRLEAPLADANREEIIRRAIAESNPTARQTIINELPEADRKLVTSRLNHTLGTQMDTVQNARGAALKQFDDVYGPYFANRNTSEYRAAREAYATSGTLPSASTGGYTIPDSSKLETHVFKEQAQARAVAEQAKIQAEAKLQKRTDELVDLKRRRAGLTKLKGELGSTDRFSVSRRYKQMLDGEAAAFDADIDKMLSTSTNLNESVAILKDYARRYGLEVADEIPEYIATKAKLKELVKRVQEQRNLAYSTIAQYGSGSGRKLLQDTDLSNIRGILSNSQSYTSANAYKKAVDKHLTELGITDVSTRNKILAMAKQAFNEGKTEQFADMLTGGVVKSNPGAKSFYDRLLEPIDEQIVNKRVGGTVAEEGKLNSRLRVAQEELDAAKTQVTNTQNLYTQADSELNTLRNDYTTFLSTGVAPVGSPYKNMADLKQAIADAEAQLTTARTNATNAATEYTAARDALNTVVAPTAAPLNPTATSKLTAPVTREKGYLPSADVAGAGVEATNVPTGTTYNPLKAISQALGLSKTDDVFKVLGAETVRTLMANPGELAKFLGSTGVGTLGLQAALTGTLGVASGGLAAALPAAYVAFKSLGKLSGNKVVAETAFNLVKLRGLPEGTAELFKGVSSGELSAILRESGINKELTSKVTNIANSSVAGTSVSTAEEASAVAQAVRDSVMRGSVDQAGVKAALEAYGFETSRADDIAKEIMATSSRQLGAVSQDVTSAYEILSGQLSRRAGIQAGEASTQFKQMVTDRGTLFGLGKGELAARAKRLGETSEDNIRQVAESVQQALAVLGENSPMAKSLIEAFNTATAGKGASSKTLREFSAELNKYLGGSNAEFTLAGTSNKLRLKPNIDSASRLETSKKFDITRPKKDFLDTTFTSEALVSDGSMANLALRQVLPEQLYNDLVRMQANNPKVVTKILSGSVEDVSKLTAAEIEVLSPGFATTLETAATSLQASNPVAAGLLRRTADGKLDIAEEFYKVRRELNEANQLVNSLSSITSPSKKQAAQLAKAQQDVSRLAPQVSSHEAAYNAYIAEVNNTKAVIESNFIKPIREARVRTQTEIVPRTSRVQLAERPNSGQVTVDLSNRELGELKRYAAQVPRDEVIAATSSTYDISPQAAEELLLRNNIISPVTPPASMLQAPVEQAAGGAMQYAAPVGVAGAGAGAVYYGSRPGRSQYYNQQQQQQPPGMYPRASFGANALSAPVIGMHKVSSTRFNPLSAPVARR
jgi:hypothetical protein